MRHTIISSIQIALLVLTFIYIQSKIYCHSRDESIVLNELIQSPLEKINFRSSRDLLEKLNSKDKSIQEKAKHIIKQIQQNPDLFIDRIIKEMDEKNNAVIYLLVQIGEPIIKPLLERVKNNDKHLIMVLKSISQINIQDQTIPKMFLPYLKRKNIELQIKTLNAIETIDKEKYFNEVWEYYLKMVEENIDYQINDWRVLYPYLTSIDNIFIANLDKLSIHRAKLLEIFNLKQSKKSFNLLNSLPLSGRQKLISRSQFILQILIDNLNFYHNPELKILFNQICMEKNFSTVELNLIISQITYRLCDEDGEVDFNMLSIVTHFLFDISETTLEETLEFLDADDNDKYLWSSKKIYPILIPQIKFYINNEKGKGKLIALSYLLNFGRKSIENYAVPKLMKYFQSHPDEIDQSISILKYFPLEFADKFANVIIKDSSKSIKYLELLSSEKKMTQENQDFFKRIAAILSENKSKLIIKEIADKTEELVGLIKDNYSKKKW